MTAHWLAALQQNRPLSAAPAGEWRLVEVGFNAKESWRAGHIPGADYMDTGEVESPPLWNVISPQPLRHTLLKHGLRADTTVILYGRGNYAPERLGQILLYAGVKDVRLLDGGWQSWLRAGMAQEKGNASSVVAAKNFGTPVPAQADFLLDIEQTSQMRALPETVLVSIRSWLEYNGIASGYDYLTPGDIPGARWGMAEGDSQYIANFHHPDGTVRAPAEIAALWHQQQISGDQRIIFYCGTGWRASFAFFIARSLGWPNIAVYDGGWLEWSQHFCGNTNDPAENP
ncbi:rhodanese-like domain-containing protein [Enterobacter sp. Bisph1]|uniref:sulfurtransferase n=1 Tax=Enterobacter sp. Bisph1 TaxID=1274399 RepID=UPI001E557D73|nr:rhodanese-like domain-containing protein [Enterobacter sp. Bisph1]